MELSELAVGQEYYTASDKFWATGQLGGRMRVLSATPTKHFHHLCDERDEPMIRCQRLSLETGEPIQRFASEVGLDGFRGTWAEVGAPLLAAHQGSAARAKELTQADLAVAQALVKRLERLGVFADFDAALRIERGEPTGAQPIVRVDYVQLTRLLDRLDAEGGQPLVADAGEE
jgi:hypothetical protein